MAMLIPLVLLLLVIAGLASGIILWATSGKGSGDSGLACGNCGYAVRGLEQLNCPECGVDLREAGIQPPGNPGRRVTGMVLTFVSGGLLLLGCLMSGFLFVQVGQPTTVTIPNATNPPSATTSSGSSTIPAPTADPPEASDGEQPQDGEVEADVEAEEEKEPAPSGDASP